MQKKLIIALALSLAFVAGISIGVSQRERPLQLERGTLLEPSRAIAPFALRSTRQAQLRNEDLRDRWTLLFFGFTNCPDICPATLQLLKGVRAQLQAEFAGERVPDVLLVSVDPGRDTIDALQSYTAYFGDGFSGATADDAALADFAADLGIVYLRVDLDGGDYTMDHSGAVLLIDPAARLRAVFSPPLNAAGIADDLRAILRRET